MGTMQAIKTEAALVEFMYSRASWGDWTRAWYRSKLGKFVAWAVEQGASDTSLLTAALAHRYYEELRRRGLASASVTGYGRCIRAWYGWLAREELLSERVVKKLEVPRPDYTVKRTLEREDFRKLFRAAEARVTAWEAARDGAVLAVLSDTGVRASELCGLRVEQVFLTEREGYIRVMGKGRKERECGLGRQARAALVKYLYRYRRAREGVDTVFTSRVGRPLTVNGLEKLVDRLARDAGLSFKLYPHLFRHSYARHYLANGGDVYKLSRLLGHEGVEITTNYLRDVRAAEARVGASILDAMTGLTTGQIKGGR